MAATSFTRGCLTSIVWLSLVRKRSVCPLSRRSLGRMRTPVCKLTGYGITPERVDQFAGKDISNRLKLANIIETALVLLKCAAT